LVSRTALFVASFQRFEFAFTARRRKYFTGFLFVVDFISLMGDSVSRFRPGFVSDSMNEVEVER
jgi:hypothetical protein